MGRSNRDFKDIELLRKCWSDPVRSVYIGGGLDLFTVNDIVMILAQLHVVV